MARPALGAFRDVFDFVDNPTMEGSGLLNPATYAASLLKGEEIRQGSPLAVSSELHELASEALAGVKKIEVAGNQKELIAVLEDIRAQAWLGKYYAEKIRAAVYLAIYLERKKAQDRSSALVALEEARKSWVRYAELSEKNYKPQMLARTHRLDWSALTDSVSAEIVKLNNLK